MKTDLELEIEQFYKEKAAKQGIPYVEDAPPVPEGHRYCVRCFKDKPVVQFYFSYTTRKYMSICKLCNSAYGRKYRRKLKKLKAPPIEVQPVVQAPKSKRRHVPYSAKRSYS